MGEMIEKIKGFVEYLPAILAFGVLVGFVIR